MSKLFQIYQTTDRIINALQSNIAQAVRPLQNNPLSDGTLLSGKNLVVGTNVINHGLNAPLQGYFIVMQTAAFNYYDLQATNPTPAKNLLLVSDTAVTVSIYVF